MEAAVQDSAECAELLIKAGANINHTNKYQNTPLHCATTNNNKDVVDVLIKYKADIMRKNYVSTSISGAEGHLSDFDQESSYLLSYRKTRLA